MKLLSELSTTLGDIFQTVQSRRDASVESGRKVEQSSGPMNTKGQSSHPWMNLKVTIGPTLKTGQRNGFLNGCMQKTCAPVLPQNDHPAIYKSRNLATVEQSFSNIEQQALAVMFAVTWL